jgi:hypothetical protein
LAVGLSTAAVDKVVGKLDNTGSGARHRDTLLTLIKNLTIRLSYTYQQVEAHFKTETEAA